jgi:hypothetical protein
MADESAFEKMVEKDREVDFSGEGARSSSRQRAREG